MPNSSQFDSIFAQTGYGSVVEGLIERRRSREQEQVTPQEIEPFYPNPGSQSDLFFNVLGFAKGESARWIDYPQGQAESIKQILEKENYDLEYPEVLSKRLKVYPVEESLSFNPQYPNILYRAGSRTGKTWGGCAFAESMTRQFPNSKGLISANTIAQLRDSTITTLLEHLVDRNVPFSPWRGTISATANSIAYSKQMTINGCTVICRSAADFMGGENASQAILGLGFLWAWLDEWLRIPSREPFDVLSTRMSQPGTRPIRLITSTINTDNPYNWGYDLFDSDERSPEMKERFISLTGSTIENRHRISETYVQDQYAQMLPEFFKIHVLGQYAVTSTGKAYNYFDRDKHVKPITQNAALTQILMFDFNRSPACATIGQLSSKTIEVYKEFYLLNSDTFQLAIAVAKELVKRKIGYVVVFGDATGNNHTANSKQTNWQIVFKELKEHGIRTRQGFKASNPAVVDRVNSVNLAFMNNDLIIDPSCRELIKDWESMQWRTNGDLDKRDLKRSHLSDGVGYAVWDINPMLQPSRKGQGSYTR